MLRALADKAMQQTLQAHPRFGEAVAPMRISIHNIPRRSARQKRAKT